MKNKHSETQYRKKKQNKLIKPTRRKLIVGMLFYITNNKSAGTPKDSKV